MKNSQASKGVNHYWIAYLDMQRMCYLYIYLYRLFIYIHITNGSDMYIIFCHK